MDIDDNYLFVSNCNDVDDFIQIEKNTFQTNYLKYTATPLISNKNAYISFTSTILYSEPNTFCIYQENKCDVEYGMPIRGDQMGTIKNYILTDQGSTLKLIISENTNIDFDAFTIGLEGINSILITSKTPNLKISGKIKTPETFTTEINNLNIDGFTIDIDVDIKNGISSFFNVRECQGNPLIKIIPHDIPKNLNEWGDTVNQEIDIIVLKYASHYKFSHQKLPIEGGFIVPSNIIKGENGNQTITIKYSFDEIVVKPNENDQFCLYESDESKCPANVTKIKSSDFCSSNLINSIKSNSATFAVVNDIIIPPDCNIDYGRKDSSYLLNIYGKSRIKGHISLSTNVEMAFFNSELVDQLHITINFQMPHISNSSEIKYGKILLYEGCNPQSLTVNVSNYIKDIETQNLESQQFVQGICLSTENIIPVPFTRDFRIKVKCSNTNGIYGMKLKFLTQDYDPNQFCYYETDITKCILNNDLERFLPIKYSSAEPSFVAEGNDPSIYLFEKSKQPLSLSFQMASLHNHKTATVVNNDETIVHFYVPIDFVVETTGSFSQSEVDFEYNPVTKKYGTFKCSGKGIMIHPIVTSHDAFVYSHTIGLSTSLQPFSSFLKQEKVEISRIVQESDGIIIKQSTGQFNILSGRDKDISTIVKQLYSPSSPSIVTFYLSEEMELNPFNVKVLNLGIKSTQMSVLTLDMMQSRADTKLNNRLYIENANITFKNPDFANFGDLDVTFINCIINKESIDKIQGNHLKFDRQSYDSFFSTKNNIYAFNGDEIEATQSFIYLGDERFDLIDTPLIHLNNFNIFSDRYGRSFEFTGADSTLGIKQTSQKTKMSFKDFDNLNVISNNINDYVSLTNVKKCNFKFGNENDLNVISTLDITNRESTEINTNGNLLIKKANISGNIYGNHVTKIEEIDIPENINAIMDKITLTKFIHIGDNSNLTMSYCSSNDPISIKIESVDYSYPQLILDSETEFELSSLVATMKNKGDINKHYLVRGIGQNQCDTFKDKVHIIDNVQHDITTNYEIKCEDDSDISKIVTFQHSDTKNKSGLSTGAIIGIAVAGFVAIIASVVFLYKHKKFCFKKKEDSSANEDNRDNEIAANSSAPQI